MKIEHEKIIKSDSKTITIKPAINRKQPRTEVSQTLSLISRNLLSTPGHIPFLYKRLLQDGARQEKMERREAQEPSYYLLLLVSIDTRI